MATSIRVPWRSSDASCQQLGQETIAEQAIVGRWNQAEAMGAMASVVSNDPRVLTVLTLGDPQALPLGEYRRSSPKPEAMS